MEMNKLERAHQAIKAIDGMGARELSRIEERIHERRRKIAEDAKLSGKLRRIKGVEITIRLLAEGFKDEVNLPMFFKIGERPVVFKEASVFVPEIPGASPVVLVELEEVNTQEG